MKVMIVQRDHLVARSPQAFAEMDYLATRKINAIQVRSDHGKIEVSNIFTLKILVTSDCTGQQNNYDGRKQDGQLGYMEMRPMCDGDGKYESYKCIPNEV